MSAVDEVHVEVEETPTVETVRKVWRASPHHATRATQVDAGVNAAIASALLIAREGLDEVNISPVLSKYAYVQSHIIAELRRRGFTLAHSDGKIVMGGWENL